MRAWPHADSNALGASTRREIGDNAPNSRAFGPGEIVGAPGVAHNGVMRRLIALLICLPLAATHLLVTHQLSYMLVAPDATQRAELLASTGHGYLQDLPIVLMSLAATVLVGFAFEAVRIRGSDVERTTPAWPFAVLAPTCFVVQEHLERLVHDGSFPAGAWHEKTFVLGLALQAPVALLAWLIARMLLRAAPRIAALFHEAHPGRRGAAPSCRAPREAARASRASVLATRSAGRAPPMLS